MDTFVYTKENGCKDSMVVFFKIAGHSQLNTVLFSIICNRHAMYKRPVILNTETKANSTLFSIEAVSLRFANGQERIFRAHS